MRLVDPGAFLVLERHAESDHHVVRIISSAATAIRGWMASTRISPIFRIEGFGTPSPSEYAFRGEKALLFLGPVHPEPVLAHCKTKSRIWLTLGLFNVMVVPSMPTELDALQQWARENGVPHELWRIKNGTVTEVHYWKPVEAASKWRNTLEGLSQTAFATELREALGEYCPLMAATVCRSATLPGEVFHEVAGISDSVSTMLSQLATVNAPHVPYCLLGQLLTINAGLSRFSSQTFAGTSPIASTECHLWSHSLLGIGVASIALRNFRHFLDLTLGAARLPERFAEFAKITEQVPNLCDSYPPYDDLLAKVHLPANGMQPLVPLLTCYSARDGYRSTETTISAPLAAVSSCNSLRWSLMTLTHEFSHVVVRGILADLLPDFNNREEVRECINWCQPVARRNGLRSIFDGPTVLMTTRSLLVRYTRHYIVMLRWSFP